MTSSSVRILQGDCRDVLPTLRAASVGLVLTDIPYGISNARNTRQQFSGYTSNKGAWDVVVPASEWVPAATRVLRPGGLLAVFGNMGVLAPVLQECERLGLRFQTHISWHKTNPAPCLHRRMLTPSNEFVLVFSNGARWTFNYAYAKRLNGGKQHHNHFEAPAVRRVQGVTRKPPALCEKLVRMFSKPSDVVCDPFAGSGGILLGARLARRRVIGIEISKRRAAFLRREIR